MGKTLFSGRFAVILCVIAGMCSAHGSFAQTPIPYDGKPTIIGRWKLVTINGSKAEGQMEEIEFEDKRLRVREDCNSATYSYVIKDEQMTAIPGGITLVGCNEDKTPEEQIALRNQYAIATAIIRSKVLLNGDTLTLLPNSWGGELVFHRLDWFEIGRRPGP
jgi:hypothetical protein